MTSKWGAPHWGEDIVYSLCKYLEREGIKETSLPRNITTKYRLSMCKRIEYVLDMNVL